MGSYERVSTVGEPVHAFVPAPLPPVPPLVLDGPLQGGLEAAAVSLGKLNGISGRLPDPEIFLYTCVRKEAVLSSQIEGTQSSLSDLLLFEAAPGAPLDDITEVSNCVAALEHGLHRLDQDFPLSNRLLCELHGVLLRSGRGSDRTAGEFRRSQNWIGGTRPGNAAFVPPPPAAVPDCMAALERFFHAGDRLPSLIRAGLAHVQFATIHPFLDGNGRVGRLLVTLLLHQSGLMHRPLLYLSLYFKQHRTRYYEQLNHVRQTGDWEAWVGFFLEGVRVTAEGAVTTVNRLLEMFDADRITIERFGRRAGSALRVHEALKGRPILSLAEICKRTTLSFPAASSAMELLVEKGIAREITGRRRARLFAYHQYLQLLNEGAEMP